jgi:hypothetical protein
VSSGEVARAVRAALDALAGSPEGALAARFTAPLLTAIVVDAAEGPWLVPALAEVALALEQVGVPRGRQFVLLGCDSAEGAVDARARAGRLRREVELAVIAHDPGSAGFTAGRTADGTALELDDELREAEAIICIGRGFATAGRVQGGPYLLFPGVACARARRAFAAARTKHGEAAALALALAAETAAPVDLAVCWDDHGRIVAARGREHFRALARATGFA